MTVICGGGASQSKPGFNITTVVTSAAVEGLLTLAGLEAVAAVLAPVIAGTTYELTTFCTTDPPPDPGLTPQDLIDVLNFADPTVSFPAIAKAKQWFESRYWYSVCECASVTTPLPPALSNPGPVSTNPGLPAISQPCFSGQITQDWRAPANVSDKVLIDLSGKLLPITGAGVAYNATIGNATDVPILVYPIPAGFTALTYSADVLAFDAVTAGDESTHVAFVTCKPDGTVNGSFTLIQAQQNTHRSGTLNAGVHGYWESGATHFAIWGQRLFNTPQSSITERLSIQTQFTCTGNALQQQCCPPDPLIENKLNQILGLLNAVYQGLPSPVHSYAEGAIHSGLSGSGFVPVSGAAIAAKVILTTIPNYASEKIADPNVYFDAGFVTPATAEGPYTGMRVNYQTQVFLLPLLPSAIHYAFLPGIVAEIVELTAGP